MDSLYVINNNVIDDNIGLSEKLVCLKATNFSIKPQNKSFDINPLDDTLVPNIYIP